MNQCLIVFTRYPEAGKTKTRLIPLLGDEGAANLHRQMTEHTLVQVKELQNEHFLSVEVHFAGGDRQLMQDWLGADLIYQHQVEGDLGWRMSVAFRNAFISGMKSVVIIGTDCPSLSAKSIAQAFQELSFHDLVLGPALDGGYYSIGLRRLIPQLFANIDWGTSRVLQQTVEIAEKLNLDVAYLPTLADIDRPEDISLLPELSQMNSN